MSVITEEQFEERLRGLLEDSRSGSRLIALRAAALMDEAASGAELTRTGLIRMLKDACRRLEKAHASMRAVTALCDDTMLVLDTAPPEAELRRRLSELFQRWSELYQKRVMAQIFANTYPLLTGCDTVISHSHSSTVFSVLKEFVRKRLGLKVVQSISWPNKEGLMMAEMLAECDIETELIADARLAEAAGRADAVIVGADVVGLDGVVNKIGTLGLALAAQRFEKPIYALFDTTKLLPPDAVIEIGERDPEELATPRNERITVSNVYFERTPLDLFSYLITEEGAFDPGQMRSIIENMQKR